MLLMVLGVSGLLLVEEKCFGSDFSLPSTYTPVIYKGPLYFTPNGDSGRGSRRTLMDNGEAKVPRLKVSYASVRLTDLRETDEGTYSVSFREGRSRDIVKLKVLDCADETMKVYGASYTFRIQPQTEYVEFEPLHSSEELMVLWNRSDSQVHKDQLHVKWNKAKITHITQANAGYYNLRRKDNSLLARELLKVEGQEEHRDRKVDENFHIQYPFSSDKWTVTYKQQGDSTEQVLVDMGIMVREVYSRSPFSGRFSFSEDDLEIFPLKLLDSGTFLVKDPQGNVALTVFLEVDLEPAPTYVYILIIVGAVSVVIICICCVRRCCCKKSSSKREEPPTAVYYHDQNQPSRPAYSAAHPKAFTPVPVSSSGPSVAALGPQAASPALGGSTNFLSSDPEPIFQPKGINFASAPPLSSESAFCDVYTSDKLNFL